MRAFRTWEYILEMCHLLFTRSQSEFAVTSVVVFSTRREDVEGVKGVYGKGQNRREGAGNVKKKGVVAILKLKLKGGK
jgi:hypothetical protein